MTPSKLAALTQLTVLLAAPVTHARDDANPTLKILGASLEGAHCPAGSGYASISDDGEAITVTFSTVEVATESGEQSEAQCRVRLELDVPEGYSFSGLGVAASGYYGTVSSGRANFTMSYMFPATGGRQRFAHRRLRGDTDYVFRHVADRLWSPCGGSAGEPVVLYLDLNLATSGAAYINTAAVDADVRLASELTWRACQE